MKGKEALSSANARYQAALDHIDRLTSELVEAKRRAREAEVRANRLEGIEKLVDGVSEKHDRMLVEAFDKLQWWQRVAKEDHDRRTAAMSELGEKFFSDLRLHDLVTIIDRQEFLQRRYPKLLSALEAGRTEEWDVDARPARNRHSPMVKITERLHGDELRRFQLLVGERAAFKGREDIDFAQAWADVLDAKQAQFSADDIGQYIFGADDLAEKTPK